MAPCRIFTKGIQSFEIQSDLLSGNGLQPAKDFYFVFEQHSADCGKKIKYSSWVPNLTIPVTMLYVPMLYAFVSVLKCSVDWQSSDDPRVNEAERCYEFTVINPLLYSSLSLIGYTVMYSLMTTYLTAAENEDFEEGLIDYTRISVIIMKNGYLMLTISSLLLRKYIFREAWNIVLLVIMLGYNIFFRS
ncbi:hypothetical protein ROZALSC1DRAFT_27609, partial [Rozella allomycis CSF55]